MTNRQNVDIIPRLPYSTFHFDHHHPPAPMGKIILVFVERTTFGIARRTFGYPQVRYAVFPLSGNLKLKWFIYIWNKWRKLIFNAYVQMILLCENYTPKDSTTCNFEMFADKAERLLHLNTRMLKYWRHTVFPFNCWHETYVSSLLYIFKHLSLYLFA